MSVPKFQTDRQNRLELKVFAVVPVKGEHRERRRSSELCCLGRPKTEREPLAEMTDTNYCRLEVEVVLGNFCFEVGGH